MIYFGTFCLFALLPFFQCETKLSKYLLGHFVQTFSYGNSVFNNIINMNSQILSSGIYHLQDQLKNTWLLNPVFKEILIFFFKTYCLYLLPTIVMIICFSIIPFLRAHHNCVLINKWKVFWHWFICSRYDSFWESVMLPHFSGDKLNSDEICDSPKSLYYPKVSFQRSEMRESRLNFPLIWAQALFSLALCQCLLPTDLQDFSQFLL